MTDFESGFAGSRMDQMLLSTRELLLRRSFLFGSTLTLCTVPSCVIGVGRSCARLGLAGSLKSFVLPCSSAVTYSSSPSLLQVIDSGLRSQRPSPSEVS